MNFYMIEVNIKGLLKRYKHCVNETDTVVDKIRQAFQPHFTFEIIVQEYSGYGLGITHANIYDVRSEVGLQ